ncbi:MAG: hypothetical protein DWQ10_05875 [Calditrichaeota bacterium]|nr:MAG: hypothetical protein DWQ10_05875 [Calditrichota bacterium]
MKKRTFTGFIFLMLSVVIAPGSAQTTSVELSPIMEPHASTGRAPIKCGVPALSQYYEIQKEKGVNIATQFSRRPSMQYSYVTPSGLFRLHYDLTGIHQVPPESTNDAGVPDWIYEAGIAAEYAHTLLVDTLGFDAPPSDNNVDGPEIDFYFKDINYYGQAIPESDDKTTSSYLEIENDLKGFPTSGFDGIRVTIVHEYFHSIHYGYKNVFSLTNVADERFFYEMSSTWFEDRAYDEVNDYFYYLPAIFEFPELPPFEYSDNNNRVYGIAILLKYWFRNHEESGLNRMWDNFRSMRGLTALATEMSEQGVLFSTALAEFYGWCLYTGFRAQPDKYFEEGADYPMMTILDTLQIDQSKEIFKNINALSARYAKLNFESGKLFTALVTDGPDGGRLAAVGEKTTGKLQELAFGTSFKMQSHDNEGGALIVLVNGTIPVSQGQPYRTDKVWAEFKLRESEDETTHSLAPNPFKLGGAVEGVELIYEAGDAGPFEIKIFNEAGQLVWKKDTYNLFKESWTGRNLDGNLVPSGVYFVVVPASGKERSKVLKLAVIR